MTEEWRDIKGYEGIYQVSNMGRVRSLDRYDSRGHKRHGKVISSQIEQGGYVSVKLKSNRCKVHRLVAQAFIPNPNNYPVINHKDENKQNNHVENLEWCTNKYNCNYGTRNKRSSDTFYRKYIKDGYEYTGVDRGDAKRPVCQFDLNGNFLRRFNSVSDATRYIFDEIKIGGKSSPISRCCDGRYRQIYGYIWRYEKDCTDDMIENGIDVISLFNLRAKCRNCGGEFIQNIKSSGRDFCSRKCYKQYIRHKKVMEDKKCVQM